ncbi:ERF family protein [Deltaproteobacteria bacterium]|nr:ERF family protein [Deltaproteobacteria bacterium]
MDNESQEVEVNEIGELAEALSKAQGQMEAAAKDKNNPFFKSKYADLASVWGACRDPLSKNGLAVVQTTSGPFDSMVVITDLIHKSGQSVRGVTPVKMVKQDMQGMGAAITYARRFALAAIVGVYQDDDDGNGASQAKGSSQPEVQKPAPQTDFDIMMQKGWNAIESGKSSAEKVIAHIMKRYQLTQEHIDTLNSVKVKK